jgi:hypothetical protein
MESELDAGRNADVEKQKPLPNQTQSGRNSIGVSWEFEPAEDASHRLNLIFNLLLNNKLR